MSGRSPGMKGGPPPGHQGSRCLLILQRSLAIQLQKVAVGGNKPLPSGGEASEYWMYDSGYLLFQGFLEANLKCFWNASLLEAMKLLQFQGYVAPGVLLVSSSACALEVVRAAWTRNVLKPPNNYVIAVVGDIEDCLVQPLPQGQFTPLPEALCWVILDLTSSGEPAVLEKIRTTLGATFPSIQRPSTEVIYDALAKLSADRKVYQTSQGYFVVTPERRRRDSTASRRHSRGLLIGQHEPTNHGVEQRQLLMSPEEALTLVHGEMSTIRDGDVTHQSVQTNLADVICGGNPNDKILYARVAKRSSSFPPGRLERRHSLRFFGSSKRLSSPSRGGSMRHIAGKHLPQSDSSSSTEYPSTDSTSTASPKKSSLLSRLFRRSKRAASVPPTLSTYSAQFPPAEWFNQRVVHMHSVGTQTNAAATATNSMAGSLGRSQVSFATWTDDEGGFSHRASTLPRRHRRHDSAASSLAAAALPAAPASASATPRSSRRHRSPSLTSTMPRSSVHTAAHSLCASRSSILPHLTAHGSNFSPCKSSATTLSSEQSHSSKAASNSSGNKTSPVPRRDDGFERSSMRGSYRRPTNEVYENSNGVQKSPRVARSGRSQYQNSNGLGNGVPLNGNVYAGRENGIEVEGNSQRLSSSPLKRSPVLSQPSSPARVSSSGRPSESPVRNRGLQNINGIRSSVGKGQCSPGENKMPGVQRSSQLSSPAGKNSITLQVSTNHSTPSLNSGYSNQSPSSNPSTMRESPSSVTVTSESPISSTTTTTTFNGSNTKIFVQQQNSPVRSLITFENGFNKAKKDYDEILILNEPEKSDKENFMAHGTKESSFKRQRPKLERPTSLCSPREVMKSGFGKENKIKPDIIRRFPSVESLTCSEITLTNSEEGNCNFSNVLHNNHCRVEAQVLPTPARSTQIGNGTNQNAPNRHPNLQTPSTPTSSGKTMNNTRKLSNSELASLSSGMGRDGLSYKNVFGNATDNPFGSKNNVTSPDKTFDSTGSFNNLFVPNLEAENKLSTQQARDFSSTRTLDDLKECKSDLGTFPSLSDLSVGLNFKSIAAQKILQGISINSIDTLVEVNMAAAEKLNNCDLTVHTDFGLV